MLICRQRRRPSKKLRPSPTAFTATVGAARDSPGSGAGALASGTSDLATDFTGRARLMGVQRSRCLDRAEDGSANSRQSGRYDHTLRLLAAVRDQAMWVEIDGSFLVRHLAFFFVPITVGRMDAGPLFATNCIRDHPHARSKRRH